MCVPSRIFCPIATLDGNVVGKHGKVILMYGTSLIPAVLVCGQNIWQNILPAGRKKGGRVVHPLIAECQPSVQMQQIIKWKSEYAEELLRLVHLHMPKFA